ncbi:MAG: hypothetical protein IIC55_10540, partial [Proteobacteria bacterium]|nr:hypothetical protein [Pseudomonadota bacterium]
MKFNKEQVAARQLDTAIRMMFDGGDIVSVHTLAAAAATVFRNLLEDTGEDTWTDAIIEAFPGGKKQARQF